MQSGEIRCPGKIVGKVHSGTLEVKCSSNRCGAGNGTIVMHYFDLLTGSLINTRTFREPSKLFQTKKEASASCR